MSNRLTFSLASLVLIIALGLVFGTVPVIADDGGTAIPAGEDTANHGTDGHANQAAANTAENTDADHKHPQLTISATDADPTMMGTQVVPTAVAATVTDPTATEWLSIAFPVEIKIPANTYSGISGTARPDANTLSTSNTTGASFIGNADGGAVVMGDFALKANTTYVITAVATVTLVDDGVAGTTNKAQREAVLAAKTPLEVKVMVAHSVVYSSDTRGVYTGQASLPAEMTFTLIPMAVETPAAKKAATVTVADDTYHGGGRFQVTITFDEAGVVITADDIDTGSNARILPGTFNDVDDAPEGKTQYTVIVEANLPSEKGDIVVTIASSSTVAEPAATGGSVMVKAVADTPPPTLASGTYALSGSLPAKGFGIITRAAVDGIDSPLAMVAMMPDLQRFFAERGSITLYTTDTAIKANDVVISEVMWGLNLTAAEVAMRKDHQWIELYNATNSAIDLSKIQINFNRSFALPSDTDKVDQFSNVYLAGWTVDQGQNGSLNPGENAAAVDLVSMYRNINYNKIETELGKATLNRGERNKGIPNGRSKGSWLTSNVADIYAANRIGSPGMKHISIGGNYGPTSVPRSPIIITEVGNLTGESHDWIELTALANVNLEKYELQYVKSDQSIVVLAQFVKKQLNAGEILLVLGTHPSNANHPVAAGKEWKLAVADQVKPKASSLYHVDSRMKLPDSIGKATFILRKEKGKTNHEHIVDLAGNLFIADSSAAYRTSLWPLRATGAGHGNVIDGDVEDFNAPRAYRRNDRGSGIGEKDWNTHGYTGIGYDRMASGANAPGTPGFDNSFARDKNTALTGGSVTISEIMYERVGNAPQWIELYNSSKTEGVNLNEWKLRIENARDDTDVDIRFRPTIQFGTFHLAPNETVLIVSAATGQNSGNFPRHRVIDLWATTAHRNELESGDAGRNYQLLSTDSFKLTLIEKGGATVETVGNLGMDWELPASEAGERGSIIREYIEREASDGTMEDSWTHASTSPLTRSPVELYYGRRDDMGTPGFRAGGPLPVSLSKFRPELLDDGTIAVRWITESELDNAGFNILRSDTRDGEFTKLNAQLIEGQGTTSERTLYEFVDKTAKPNVVYYYQIQDVSLDGDVTTLRQSRLKGHVSAAGKLTTTWGELKALQ